MNRWCYIFALMMLLSIEAFSAFIQSPIPPSTSKNFYYDTDGDGRMDKIAVRFLGPITQEYIDQMVDSLTFEWVNENGDSQSYSIYREELKIDESNARLVYADLSKIQNKFYSITTLSSLYLPSVAFGGASLFLSDNSVYHLVMKDGMAPTIKEARLKSYRGKSDDSLFLTFSERVLFFDGCNSYLEFKSARDSSIRVLPHSQVSGSFLMQGAVFVFDRNLPLETKLYPRDSIRLLVGCTQDSVANLASDNGKFIFVDGSYPFALNVPSMAYDYGTAVEKDEPVFSLLFIPSDEFEEEDDAWGISMDVLGPEFENSLKEELRMDTKESVDLSKLSIYYHIRIYTNLGAYVTGTSTTVMGDDFRFKNASTRLFLRWNFMDGLRRRVTSGAYLAHIAAVIKYNGKVVFRNDADNGAVTKVFGIIRR